MFDGRVSEGGKRSENAVSNQGRTRLMIISSAVLAVAPKCPFCLAAFFGTFGLATVSDSVYRVWLPPVTAAWLALTVAMLAFQFGGQRRYGPAVLGLFAGLAVFSGKFMLDDQALVYAGIAALLGAAVWRAWVRKATSSEICTQCGRLPLLHSFGKAPAGLRGGNEPENLLAYVDIEGDPMDMKLPTSEEMAKLNPFPDHEDLGMMQVVEVVGAQPASSLPAHGKH